MYSKEKGITYGKPIPTDRMPTGRSPFGEPAYRRREPVRVPANYSGHAIVDGEERPLGSLFPPAGGGGEADLPRPSPYTPEPHFEGLPRVSELGDRRLPPPRILPSEEMEGEDDWLAEEDAPLRSPPSQPVDAVAGTPPPPKPSALSVFGHGIGTEELLIMGLILFLLLEGGEGEDRGDLTETVILLGLLLVLGW